MREWLAAQAASGWVDYDADGDRYSMSPEQALMFADPSSPAFVGGAFQLALGSADAREHIAEAFVTGTGFGWHEHDHDVFEGCRALLRARLPRQHRPVVDPGARRRGREAQRRRPRRRRRLRPRRLVDRDRRGATRSATVHGTDAHDGSIAEARRLAAEAGVDDRVTFATVAAPTRSRPTATTSSPSFDCLHDMGDPVGAARQVRAALAPDGTWMIVEPCAGDRVRGQPQPGRARVLRVLDAAVHARARCRRRSGSRSAPRRARRGCARCSTSAGFTSVRRAAETPFNLVLEARP